MQRILCALAIAALLVQRSLAASPETAAKKVDDFKLQDYRGGEHSLAAMAKNKKIVVIAFVGTECPLVKLYGPVLAELAEKYGHRGVAFVGIDSNRQDALSEIAAFARDAGIKFPILKDTGNAVADRLGAERTPEVVVLDKNHTVRYQGRIDDRYGVGYAREKTTQHYLTDALDALLAGKEVATSKVESVGCFIGRVREPAKDAPVTYSNQVARILQDRCVECHRAGEIGPFALDEYSEVAGWADTIAEVIRDRRMPPWHANPKHGSFRNDRSMPDAEKELIYQWAAAGAPEGNPADLPKPRTYVAGWTLPREPDLVLDVQSEPYTVPAEGVIAYQNFIVDPGFTEDKWIMASQILPGCAPVVHHVLCFVQPPSGSGRVGLDENGLGFLAAYVPGFRATPYPDGMAKFVPAGSKLMFQMHYTPVGKAQHDLSKIGFVFAKPEDLTHMVQTVSTGNRGINIPPNAEDYSRESLMTPYKHDLIVLSYSPHMHVRGKAFTYEAIYPDGKRETLLDVPRYDFNWQTNYELTEQKVLPPGTRVHCTAHWDNSENNLSNPNPNETVRWGDQTWEEMMIGFFDVAVPIDREKLLASGTVPRLEPVQGSIEDRAKELLTQMDVNGDGKLTKDELPERFQTVFGLIDANRDQSVDLDETVKFLKATGGRFGGGDRPNVRPGGGRRAAREAAAKREAQKNDAPSP